WMMAGTRSRGMRITAAAVLAAFLAALGCQGQYTWQPYNQLAGAGDGQGFAKTPSSSQQNYSGIQQVGYRPEVPPYSGDGPGAPVGGSCPTCMGAQAPGMGAMGPGGPSP